jgi:hypothetical protein
MTRKLRVFVLPSLIVAVLWFAAWTDSTARRSAVTRIEAEVVHGTFNPGNEVTDDEPSVALLGELDLGQQTVHPSS